MDCSPSRAGAAPSRGVAVVLHFFSHYRGPVIKELVQRGRHDYLFVGDSTNRFRSGVKPWAIPPEFPVILASCRKIWGPILYQKGLLRLALRRDLDCIIYAGCMYRPCTWLSAVLARLTGKRVLFWTHGWLRREPMLQGLVRRMFYRLAHGLLLYGHRAKILGIEYGFAPERLHVIYNSLDHPTQLMLRQSIDRDSVRGTRQRFFSDPDTPMAICTTRLSRHRRLEQLLAAVATLRDAGHRVNLLLVGNGPERAALEAQAHRLSLPVHFYGACYDEPALAELIAAASVTVAPGMVGLTAMHSLVYGTPVITHDNPNDQMPEAEAIVPGRTGDLFRWGDVASLAEAIRRWTATPMPDERVRRDCYAAIDRFYTPAFQRAAIDRAVDGRAADDLFWTKEPACGAADRDIYGGGKNVGAAV